MKIKVLVENTSRVGFATEHGLSLHISTNEGKNILFDMGQGSLFLRNSHHMGVDINNVDVAIISHGHYDHGGGLGSFLKNNNSAQVYVHQGAFEPHYSLRDTGLCNIGLDADLQNSTQIVKSGDVEEIGEGMMLFSVVGGDCMRPLGNKLLFGPDGIHYDTFCHEQSLILKEDNKTVLIAGCAHSGILNIIHKAEEIAGCAITHVVSGMHLVKSGLDGAAEDAYISELAEQLKRYANCRFYTMHCTGEEQYTKLHYFMGNQISYLSCGEEIEL